MADAGVPAGRPAGAIAMRSPVFFLVALAVGTLTFLGFRMVQTLHEAGVPVDALAFLPGVGEDIGPRLVEHPDITFVAFTGSRAVGLDIVEPLDQFFPLSGCRLGKHAPFKRYQYTIPSVDA